MASHLHTAVWLDQQEARIFHVDLESFDETKLRSPHHHVHRHPKGSTEAREHPEDQAHFFKALAHALADSGEILVAGPGATKLHFVRHLHKHDPALEAKIVGVESSDHPTDAQLVAHVKHYFRVPDPRLR